MESFAQFGFTWRLKDIDKKDIPDYCGGDMELAKVLVHYQKTGGLRRRLFALANAASILCRLHSAGMVYGDVSQNNIYTSTDLSNNAVWFIDADNINYAGHLKGTVYTPKFGAPEIVKGTGKCTWASDSYAFAVLAYWMLTMHHPFEGAAMTAASENCDDDWASDDGGAVDENALYDGRFAFVDDPKDRSNGRGGVPSSVFINPPLMRLFVRTFCEGKETPAKRAPMIFWARELLRAAQDTLVCPKCGQSYYSSNEKCPYCDEAAPKRDALTGKGRKDR